MARAMARKYSVSIRFYGEEVSPETITNLLGICPTDVQRRGEEQSPKTRKKWRSNMWGYQSECDQCTSLEEHLMWIFKKFCSKKEIIQSLSKQVRVILWCACFSSDPETTIEITPEALAEMASFHTTLSLSVYATEDDNLSD